MYRNAWHEWLLTKEQREREIFLENGVRDLRAAWKNNRKVLCLRLLKTASIKHRRNRTVCDEFILRSNRRKLVNTGCVHTSEADQPTATQGQTATTVSWTHCTKGSIDNGPNKHQQGKSMCLCLF